MHVRVEETPVVDEPGDAVVADPVGRRRVAHRRGRVESAALSVVVTPGHGPCQHDRKFGTQPVLEVPVFPAEE